MPIAHARAVFQRLDYDRSALLSYHHFIDRVQMLLNSRDTNLDEISNDDLLGMLARKQKSMHIAFEGMDLDKDARLSSIEV